MIAGRCGQKVVCVCSAGNLRTRWWTPTGEGSCQAEGDLSGLVGQGVYRSHRGFTCTGRPETLWLCWSFMWEDFLEPVAKDFQLFSSKLWQMTTIYLKTYESLPFLRHMWPYDSGKESRFWLRLYSAGEDNCWCWMRSTLKNSNMSSPRKKEKGMPLCFLKCLQVPSPRVILTAPVVSGM